MWSCLSWTLSLTAFGSTAAIQVTQDVPPGVSSNNASVSNLLGSFRETSGTIDELAAKVPDGYTREFLSRLKVCGACTEFQRFGEEQYDGGYLVCMDGMRGGQIRAAYSMGIEQHDLFSAHVYYRLKVPIHQLDCTVPRPAKGCGDCHFYQVCLKGDKPWRSPDGTGRGDWEGKSGGHPIGPNMNMQEILNMTGQTDAPENSLFMKMDIEGSEWPIFANADAHWGLEKFKQIIFEFHSLELRKNHEVYASALKNLQNHGFKVVHIHGNNNKNQFGTFLEDGNWYQVPRMLEVTLARDVPDLEKCEARQRLHPLDKDNHLKFQPLPLAKLPK